MINISRSLSALIALGCGGSIALTSYYSDVDPWFYHHALYSTLWGSYFGGAVLVMLHRRRKKNRSDR